MSNGLKSRLCALNSLMAVFDGHTPLDRALVKNAEKLGLSSQDKSFAHALCGYVLRYKPALQDRINTAANRQSDITPSPLNILLLIGAAQIYFMNVPNHAAVNSTVELTYKIKCSKQKGFVNAVLRRLLREGDADLRPCLPQGIFKKLVDDYGLSLAKEIEEASLREAKTGIVNKMGQWSLAPEKGDAAHHGQDGLTLTSDEWVQDFASHYPISLLGDLNDKVVFDLCAAPGGKTMQLASKKAKVTAVDISEKRLRLLQDNLRRTNMTDKVSIVCKDVLKWNPNERADIVVLDVPCSATGTMRRHPDLPYVRQESDWDDLTLLQAQLLSKAKDLVSDRGLLIYCTCSLQKAEGEAQIDQFLKFHGDFERLRIGNCDPRFITDDGDLRLLPVYGDMDGFFVSFLQKI